MKYQEKVDKRGAYVSYMGAKHNSVSLPSIEEIKETISDGFNNWVQSRIAGEQEEINNTLNPEPRESSPEEMGEALVSAEKSGNYDTGDYKEAAEYTYNRDGNVETPHLPVIIMFTLANQRCTTYRSYRRWYYILYRKWKNIYGTKSKRFRWGFLLMNVVIITDFWLETNGYKPTGISNGYTYFRFYYELNNPNQLLPYNPNHQPTENQGYVDYIGYPVNQERPITPLDSKISSVIENEGEQYKPFATLSMSSSSYENRTNASLTLDDSFNKAIENLPKFRPFNKNNPEDLRDAGKNLDGYDDSKKEVYYEVKDDDGRIKRVYAGSPEKYKYFSNNDLTSRNKENMLNNVESQSKEWMNNFLSRNNLDVIPGFKDFVSNQYGFAVKETVNIVYKPADVALYFNKMINKFNDNIVIYDDFDAYQSNKMVVLKGIPDIYTYYRENMRRNEKTRFCS